MELAKHIVNWVAGLILIFGLLFWTWAGINIHSPDELTWACLNIHSPDECRKLLIAK
jgi:hypothetical protein